MSEYPLPIDYDRAEEKGVIPLCCRVIECFRPSQFAAVGYPISISSLAELWKYTECMHDGFGLGEPMDGYLLSNLLMGGFTAEELDEVKKIKDAIDDLSRSIGRPCEYPTNSILLALNQARHISALVPPGGTIVELGGGAGYLGAILVLRGYRYVATDIAQALYLMQSHLISRVAPGGCIDLLDERYGTKDLQALQPGQAAMVPWWRWAQRAIPGALSIDLLTSNHNLLEMHPFSRLYHLSVARENFSSNAVGMVFQGWGDPSRNATWTAVKDLSDRGYVLAHHDQRITCFAPEGSYAPGTVLRYPLAPPTAGRGPPMQPPIAAVAPKRRRSILERIAVRLAIRAFPGVIAKLSAGSSAELDHVKRRLDEMAAPPRNQNEIDFTTPEFANPANPISMAILTMREKERFTLPLKLDDYRALMGSDDLSTQDERFLAFIFRDTPFARPWVTSLPN